MSNIFNTVPARVPKKNRFNLSHRVKGTGEFGQLIPVFVQDVIPNDTFKVSLQNLVRFAPMLAPIMSEVDVYFHAYFVPDRIIWPRTEEFFTGAINGRQLDPDEIPSPPRYVFKGQALDDAISKVPSSSGFNRTPLLAHKSLADYLGFQTYASSKSFNAQGEYALDARPFWAYYKIWSDYYRDENLQADYFDEYDDVGSPSRFSGDRVFDSNIDPSSPIFYPLRLQHRAWKKDYFTSALPFAQKGDDVLIPGSGSGAVGSVKLNPSKVDGNIYNFVTGLAGSKNKFLSTSLSYKPNGDGVYGTNLFSVPDDGLGGQRLDINVADMSVEMSSLGEGTIR